MSRFHSEEIGMTVNAMLPGLDSPVSAGFAYFNLICVKLAYISVLFETCTIGHTWAGAHVCPQSLHNVSKTWDFSGEITLKFTSEFDYSAKGERLL